MVVRISPLVTTTGSSGGCGNNPSAPAVPRRSVSRTYWIVAPSADLDLTLRAVAFAAMGTAGQRCTSLRRLFVHHDVYDHLVPRLKQAYRSVTVGDPLESGTLIGPLIDGGAYHSMQGALEAAKGNSHSLSLDVHAK